MKTTTFLSKAEIHTDSIQFVTFTISNNIFAIDIQNVQGINRLVEVTKLPNSLPFIEGIINLRGNIIPLINLSKRLGFDHNESEKQNHFIVVLIKGILYGFIVSLVERVIKIPKELIELPPPNSLKIDSKYVEGIAKLDDKLIIILNLDNLFSNLEYDFFLIL